MPRTVIVVEDHAPVRELYAEALRGAGWRVIERPSAQGLLTLIQHEARRGRRHRLDAAGQERARSAASDQARGKTRHVRVIVLTAHSASSLREQALSAGAELFLEKPLRPDALLTALDPCYAAAHDTGVVGSVS